MRSSPAPKIIDDDLALFGMDQALQATIEVLRAKANGGTCSLKFGSVSIECDVYANHLSELQTALTNDPSGNYFLKVLHENFEFREVYGNEKWGEVFVTSYYEPVIEGSTKRTAQLTQPLYKVPADLMLVDMGQYANTFSALREYHGRVILEKSRDGLLRGRELTERDSARRRIVPYYTRQEIDSLGILKNKKLELAWVNPLDAFFLQIQGSGRVRFADGQEQLFGYAEQNGHPYYAIGRALRDRIPLEEMSLQRIEEELKKMSSLEAQNILNLNSSYVFFQKLDTAPKTAMGVDAQAGRTIATDIKYFPKGALAFLEYQRPDDVDKKLLHKSRRFVFDHDVGGAIRGPGRVDLFWGSGEVAKSTSGYMRHTGRLYYLFPRQK